jgi:hypothetical protein
MKRTVSQLYRFMSRLAHLFGSAKNIGRTSRSGKVAEMRPFFMKDSLSAIGILLQAWDIWWRQASCDLQQKSCYCMAIHFAAAIEIHSSHCC